MADGLFDNRYRYDYIYPRGRSGETLRAVDLQDKERKVVIKRPGANDAPPIRAGQEVSIMNERRALQRLAGHQVLTQLLGEGQFFVGGTAHQYIVMERAEGTIIADAVSELNAAGERLPVLETLVIVDQLLDLLQRAHDHDIVYNDVDAKHLFWQRDLYQLKVIDWGNAVFLEGDQVTPQGISRQTDVYQVGELLYFIVTGGRRADIPRDADADFRLNFGDDERRVHSILQEIISKACHPNTRHRYPHIRALRSDLTKFRQPLESDRNATLSTVTQKLKRDNLSKNELRTLRTMMEPVLEQDPGFPLAREAYDDIVNRLLDLNVEADLDAVRIYLQSQNWQKANDLLGELSGKTGSQTKGLVGFLLDITALLIESDIRPAPPAVLSAIVDMFDGKSQAAANTLLTNPPDQLRVRTLQWMIAERISSHIPEVLLLRPNLYRLRLALRQFEGDSANTADARALIEEINNTLDHLAAGSVDMPGLRDGYRRVVEMIQALNPLLQTLSVQYQLSNQQLPITAMDRALNAAMGLADSMHVIGKNAASSPRDALNALDMARHIDPPNPVWVDIQALLDQLYSLLESSQTYVPASDGTDLQDWLQTTAQQLEPFSQRLFDEMLVNMLSGLRQADKAWRRYRAVVVNGDRDEADNALLMAARSVSVISPALSAWFDQLRKLIEGSQYIERHSVPGGTGRALADGWQAFDRGRLADAERLGQQAYESARTEEERFAASRLQDISRVMREWIERSGVSSQSRTKSTLEAVENLYTSAEQDVLDNFTRQMPSTETYLKAMPRGLIGLYQRRSTAALRLLFAQYVLLGTLEVLENKLDDARFWREAATKPLGKFGENHLAVRLLDETIERRGDIIKATELFNRVKNKQILPDLESIRRQLEGNSQVNQLAPGIQSLSDIDMAFRDWQSADFRSAGLKLEKAVHGLDELEQSVNMTLTAPRAWLLQVMEGAAQLHIQQREMRAAIDQKADEPPPQVRQALNRMVTVTTDLLGENYAGQLRQWRDTYEQFLAAYTARERRSRRMEQMNELFKAMFIDQHPAYSLFRHWYAVLEASPEFPAPPTDDPTPRIAENDDLPDEAFKMDAPRVNVTVRPAPRRKKRRFSPFLLLALGAAVVISGGLFALSMAGQGGDDLDLAVTISATPEGEAVVQVTDEAENTVSDDPVTVVTDTLQSPTEEPTEAPTDEPTDIPTVEIVAQVTSPTPEPPTATNTPTQTQTPTITPTPTVTNTSAPPTRTPLPPEGVIGMVNLLDTLENSGEVFFNPNLFLPLDNGWRLGTGEATDNEILYIVPPAEFFEASFGNNAASRLRRVEATFTLRSFNPEIIGEDDLFFGLLFQSVNDGNNAGVQLQVVGNNVVNLSQIINNDAIFVNQRAVDAVIARLRVDRAEDTGEVMIYFNDVPLGQSFEFMDGDAPVLPVIFVREGGVVLGVTDWRVYFR